MSFFREIFKNNVINSEVIGLTKELKSIYTYNVFKKRDKSIVFVTSTLYEANNFYQSLLNYTDDVLLFPMDDFLTSEALAISPELEITRLETLYNITKNQKKIVVTNLMGFLRYLPSKKIYIKSIINLKVGEEIKISNIIDKLYLLGYSKEPTVNKTGEIATRGYVVDIFPINSLNPIRIEFWGDTIESIRQFDIDSQLTIDNLDGIEIVPNTEFLLDKEKYELQEKQYKLNEFLKPASIAEYLDDCCVVFDDYNQLKISYEMLSQEVFNYNINLNRPSDFKYMHDFYQINFNDFIYLMGFDNYTSEYNQIQYNAKEVEIFSLKKEDINSRLNKFINENKKVVICLSSRSKINKVIEELDNPNLVFTNEYEILDNKINIINKKITSGFELDNIIVINENELFNKKENGYQYKTNFRMGTKIKDISKIDIGDYVIHNTHGIGQYCGIKTLTKDGLKKDYIFIKYRDGDKLYIPVEQIELISKYSSKEGVVPKLNKLGTTEWQKTKLKAKQKIYDIANELLKLYAARESSVGFAFTKDTEEQKEFENEFMYKETLDQLRVIEEIKKDMEKPVPMDRLVCGDVGYGKTEVAFRAMFKAVMSNKQVAYLCPTTILSRQQYLNAIDRFSSFPINIALLNRFVTKKETNEIIRKIKEGKIDIVIGTHKLLSNNVVFKDLGLLVIDEEQRFGVRHKERIKQYKNNIDVLTLTATPIPRTLQMSMTGIRNLSLIETPPVNRYPIQTYVLAENKRIMKDAIYKELSRKGQVFLLYNNVQHINSKVDEIKKLIPEARVIAGHGQMSKKELEDVMFKFIKNEYDILVCTTIIETGIDIPTVNTLIILEADRFGLSQLYQIRGRVGRSNKIAYCYLMYDNKKILNEIATKRLNVIKNFTELGSGFAIAARDLSIRGAGDILGSEQAGFIDSIGIELFLKMLNDEIKRLKGLSELEEEEKIIDQQPLINVETSIDDSYVDDEELKIEIHKKINEIDSYETLEKIKTELEDRFGNIPEKIEIYMHEELFEKMASKIDVKKVRQTKNFIEITLEKDITKKLKTDDLFIDVNNISRMFRFSIKNNRLIITLDIIKLDKHFVYYLIELFKIIEKNIKKVR